MADRSPPGPPEEPGHVRPTSAGVLALTVALALVCGWLLRPVAVRLGGSAPVVSWIQVLVLYFVAAIIGFVAFATWRALQVRRDRIRAHLAVNRLVLAKACALVGAVLAGGYAGYALSWWGVPAELADQRILRSLVAAFAGVLWIAASLWLEFACRVGSDDEKT